MISVHNSYGLKPSQLLRERYFIQFANFLLKDTNSQHLKRSQHWAKLGATTGDAGFQSVAGGTLDQRSPPRGAGNTDGP